MIKFRRHKCVWWSADWPASWHISTKGYNENVDAVMPRTICGECSVTWWDTGHTPKITRTKHPANSCLIQAISDNTKAHMFKNRSDKYLSNELEEQSVFWWGEKMFVHSLPVRCIWRFLGLRKSYGNCYEYREISPYKKPLNCRPTWKIGYIQFVRSFD